MATNPFSDMRGLPVYDEPITYLTLGNRPFAWEFNGWKQESLSWKQGCYIHASLSSLPTVRFTGPDVQRFFASIATNSFARFSPGSMKHAVMCNEHGRIAAHGVLQLGEDEALTLFATGPWPIYLMRKSGLDVQAAPVPTFIFQVAGPTSLATLERAADESLADVRFLRFRHAVIAGHRVEVARLGMSGNLAYEVRGPMDCGPEVYDAIYKAGSELGIQRLGWRTYLVNHIEGGFPQQNWTFRCADVEDEGYRAFIGNRDFPVHVSGSVDPADLQARFRTPLQANWDSTTKFDHEFLGRTSLEQEAANPKRRTVTLRWNAEDVIDIYASLLRSGDEYKTIDLPTCPTWQEGVTAHADHVFSDGRSVGYSSGTAYSYHYREVLSMGCLDVAEAQIGNELILQWGDHGKRIKPVRVTVERYPYLDKPRNDA